MHSANDVAGAGMFYELKRAGWPVRRVRPRDHHDWVKRDWRETVKMLAAAGWVPAADPDRGSTAWADER